jgi:hypothetical protein
VINGSNFGATEYLVNATTGVVAPDSSVNNGQSTVQGSL